MHKLALEARASFILYIIPFDSSVGHPSVTLALAVPRPEVPLRASSCLRLSQGFVETPESLIFVVVFK